MRYIIFGAGPDQGPAGVSAAELSRRARDEGAAVLAAAGVDYASTDELGALRGDQVRIEPVNGSRRSGGSSWQSLSRGSGSSELTALTA